MYKWVNICQGNYSVSDEYDSYDQIGHRHFDFEVCPAYLISHRDCDALIVAYEQQGQPPAAALLEVYFLEAQGLDESADRIFGVRLGGVEDAVLEGGGLDTLLRRGAGLFDEVVVGAQV